MRGGKGGKTGGAGGAPGCQAGRRQGRQYRRCGRRARWPSAAAEKAAALVICIAIFALWRG